MSEENNLSATLPNYAIEKLHEIAKHEGFVSYKIVLPNDGFARGTGFISDVVRVKLIDTIHTSMEPRELKLICKLMPPSEIRRRVFSSIKLFEREVFMYEKILPIFQKFQLDHKLCEINGFFNIAKCFGSICEPESNKFLIILADMGARKFDTWSPKNQHIPPDHVRLLMETLGKFHGVSFAIRDQKPEYLKEFQKLDSSWLCAANEPLYVRNIDLLIGQSYSEVESFVANNSDQDLAEQLNVMRNLKDNWKNMWQQGLSNGVAEPYSVVFHGDFWNSNILFAKDKSGTVYSNCLLDWQMSSYGSPALDIAHFILTSTDKEFRRKYFHKFLEIYYKHLSATIRLCGSDPEKLFTFIDLKEQLRKFTKFPISFAPVVIAILTCDPEDIGDMDKYSLALENPSKNVERFFKFNERTRKVFLTRLLDVITDCIEYDWIKNSL